MTEPEFENLLQRYLAGRGTRREERLVERLYEALGQPGRSGISQPEQAKLLGAMWERLESRTRRPVPGAKVVHRPAASWSAPSWRWAAAALVVLAAGAGLLERGRFVGTAPHRAAVAAGNPWTRYRNATRRAQRIALPDGSLVSLGPGSSLRYATGFAGPRRAVYFSGDAFFKVSKNPDRPFLVFTSQVVTTVLGTSFRVQAVEGSPNATVTVREGRVAVQARAGAHLGATPNRPAAAGVLLLPNQQAVYVGTARHFRKELAAVPAVLAPQSFVFDARPVPEVLAALEKAYGVDIVYERDALANCTVTLDLTNKSLAGKLDVLCEALGATYEESEARILFHGKGCKKE